LIREKQIIFCIWNVAITAVTDYSECSEKGGGVIHV